MKWKAKPTPKNGDTKIVKKFALFPIRIKDEVRWLEICKIEMVYWYYYKENFYAWAYKRFIDD